jgi:hypothetical protein
MMGGLFLGLRATDRASTWVFGATAPVTAMLGWLVWHNPRGTLTFFTALRLPVWALLVASVAADTVGMFWPRLPQTDGRRITLLADAAALIVATGAHFLVRWSSRETSRRAIQTRPSATIDREAEDEEPAEEIPARIPTPANEVDEHLEAQLDAVLAKVAAHGQQSLTRAEMDILKRASEVYRKRRR